MIIKKIIFEKLFNDSEQELIHKVSTKMMKDGYSFIIRNPDSEIDVSDIQSVRKIIKVRMLKQDISVYNIAKHCECSQSTIKRFLDGKSVISVSLLLSILKYLRVLHIKLNP